MAKLNEVNEKNKKVIHLMITGMCLRNCKDCCNKQYDINDIPIISKIELDSAETVCFTGGEPCIFGDWQYLAKTYRENLPNLKNIYMYVNADELYKTYQKLNSYNSTDSIKLLDGLSISIKTKADVAAFETILKVWPEIKKLKSNRLYVFNDLYSLQVKGFDCISRKWQEDFVPDNSSIFRRLKGIDEFDFFVNLETGEIR